MSAASDKRQERAALLAAINPDLIRPSAKVNNLVAAAKNMRLELDAAYPGVKFSVRSRRFSGGDAITVRWFDGPCTDLVDQIVTKYQMGSFNGMDDSYSYSLSPWTLAFGCTKYVTTSREHSSDAVDGAVRRVWARYGPDLEAAGVERPTFVDYVTGRLFGHARHIVGNDDLSSLVSRELQRHTWFAKPARVLARWPAEELAADGATA